MRCKLGQFYLIAAVVIVGVLIGLAAVTNFVIQHRASDKQADIQDELKLESENIINHGVFNNEDTQVVLSQFAQDYKDYIGREQDVLFVYGNREDIILNKQVRVVSVFQIRNSIGITIGGSNVKIPTNTVDLNDQTYEIETIPDSDEITITIGDVNYDFELTEGKNFFFVVKQEAENE